MNIKKIIALIFATVLLFTLASCGKCEGHIDADDDRKCDKCGEDYDDGDEAPETPMATVHFTVKLDNGDTLAGISFSLIRGNGEKAYNFVTDDNGSVTADIEPGAYYYDCQNLPENCILETPGVKIQADTSSADIIVINNTPDGTAKKPFFISDKENPVTLAPGQEIFYTCHNSSEKYLKVENENVSITYKGKTYEATNGFVEVHLEAVSGDHAEFSLKNHSTEEISIVLRLEAPLGSRENPEEVRGNSLTVDISSKHVIYYVWTASEDGVLVVERPAEGVEISLTKTLEGDVPVKSDTADTGVASMEISKGDIIRIEVCVNIAYDSEPTDVQISLTINQ